MKTTVFTVDDKRNIVTRIIRESIVPYFNRKGRDLSDTDIFIEDTGLSLHADNSSIEDRNPRFKGEKREGIHIGFSFKRSDDNPLSIRRDKILDNKYLKLYERLFNYEVELNIIIKSKSRSDIEEYKDKFVDYMDRGFENIHFKPRVFYTVPKYLSKLMNDIVNKAGLTAEELCASDYIKYGDDVEGIKKDYVVDYEHTVTILYGEMLANGDLGLEDDFYTFSVNQRFQIFLPISIEAHYELLINNQIVDDSFIVESDIYADSLRSAGMRTELITTPKQDIISYNEIDREPTLSILLVVDEDGEASERYLGKIIDDNFTGIDKQLLLRNKEELFSVIGENLSEAMKDENFTTTALVEYLNGVVNGDVVNYIADKLNCSLDEAKYVAYIGGYSLVTETYSLNMNFITFLQPSNENISFILRLLNADNNTSMLVEYLLNQDATMDNYTEIIEDLSDVVNLEETQYDIKMQLIYKTFIEPYKDDMKYHYIDQIFIEYKDNYICNLRYLDDLELTNNFLGYITENFSSREDDSDVEAVVAKIIADDKDFYCYVTIDRDLNVYSDKPLDKSLVNRLVFLLLENLEYAKEKDKELLKRWEIVNFDYKEEVPYFTQFVSLIAIEE